MMAHVEELKNGKKSVQGVNLNFSPKEETAIPKQIIEKVVALEKEMDTKMDAKDIVDALKTLKGNDRLDISNIRNGEQLARFNMNDQRWHGGNTIQFKNGINLYSGITGSQTIAHGLGKIPSRLIIVSANAAVGTNPVMSTGTYNGTTTSTTWLSIGALGGGTDSTNIIPSDQGGGHTYYATVTLDEININLSWTKAGAPEQVNFTWMVEG